MSNKIKSIIKRIMFLFITGIIRCLPDTSAFRMKASLLRLLNKNVSITCRIHSKAIFDNQYFSIGNNTWIGGGCRIIGHQDAIIDIGNNCDLGPECLLVVGTHQIGTPDRRAGEGCVFPIIIQDGCWLGARTTVLGGVEIKHSTIIGACSLVTKDVPANVIAAGTPVKIIKELSDSA